MQNPSSITLSRLQTAWHEGFFFFFFFSCGTCSLGNV
jgi:hypothetical protein